MERKCENCGASLSENEKNCPYCGINEQELLLKKATSKQNNQASTQPNPKKGVFIASCICFALSIIGVDGVTYINIGCVFIFRGFLLGVLLIFRYFVAKLLVFYRDYLNVKI